VVVHPQSIIHSLVQFEDGSMKAQLGLPDMRIPIQFALSYPDRIKSPFPRFDFANYPNLEFEQANEETFRNLRLAYNALEKGGNTACSLNAANEVAVAAFLQDRIKFLEMSDLIEQTMEKIGFIKTPSLDDLIQTDKETRKLSEEIISRF